MHETVALLAALTHIAGDPCCGDDERSSRAVALVKAFSATLYERLGIASSNRPTSSAKSAADQTLAALRGQILAVETRSDEPSRATFTAARHRIEMARRVLAARLVEGGAPPVVSLGRRTVQPRASSSAPSQDRQILDGLRRSVAGRDQVARSRAAIADSLRLLAACA
jgi:hypothetical protein